MSYTQLDWLRDHTRQGSPFDRAAADELLAMMAEDGRCIVRTVEHEALVRVSMVELGITDLGAYIEQSDNDDFDMALVHWEKERSDWASK